MRASIPSLSLCLSAVTMFVFQANVLASEPAKRQKLSPNHPAFKKLIGTVFLHHNSLMQQCATPELAWALFEMVRDIPPTDTKRCVQDHCGVTVGGPISDTKPSILCAVRHNGEQMVIKLLRHKSDLESDAASEQRR